MGEVNGYTAERMKAIEDASVVNGEVRLSDRHLILTRFDESEIDAGPLGNNPLQDTVANLAATNPIVEAGRLVIATDSVPKIFGIGDGATTWTNLTKYVQQKLPYCRVSRVANQVMPHNVATTVSFDTELSDAWGIYAAGVFTVPAGYGGEWRLTSRGYWTSGATGYRQLWHSINNVEDQFVIAQANVAIAGTNVAGSVEMALTAGQQVRVRTFHNQGANVNYVGDAVFRYIGPS